MDIDDDFTRISKNKSTQNLFLEKIGRKKRRKFFWFLKDFLILLFVESRWEYLWNFIVIFWEKVLRQDARLIFVLILNQICVRF